MPSKPDIFVTSQFMYKIGIFVLSRHKQWKTFLFHFDVFLQYYLDFSLFFKIMSLLLIAFFNLFQSPVSVHV